jgi:DNA replication and repair protein RecF
MRLATVTLHNLRNHTDSTVELAPRVNVFCGMNGHGKTSILEAVSLCALSTTFVPCDEKALIRRGEDSCFAAVTAYSDLQTPYKVSVQLSHTERKLITSSLGKRLTPQDIIGEMPMIALSPDFKAITAGAPSDRRRFLDSTLSQASKLYMSDMLTLKKILKQRNSLLHAAKHGEPIDSILLDTWTDALITTSTAIVCKRWAFVREFNAYVRAAYANISGGREDVQMQYTPDALPAHLFENADTGSGSSAELSAERVHAAFAEIFREVAAQERRRGTTAAGPHKDEIVFTVAGGVAREAASQGQHKTLLIALKTAEFQYLRDVRAETPILLLDDIFSELDSMRAANVFDLLRSGAQTFVTTTDPTIFHEHFTTNTTTTSVNAPSDHALFLVENGVVSRA